MKPVMQVGSGDCLPACLASILEVPLDEIVGVTAMPGMKPVTQVAIANEYLMDFHGLQLWQRRTGDWPDQAHYIGSAPSNREPAMYHAVVMQQGKIVHDPHPCADTTVDQIEFIEVLVYGGLARA